MIWLTWRHMRTQTLWTAAALAALAVYLLYLGADLREVYDRDIAGCTAECGQAARAVADAFGTPLLLLGLVLIAGPALLGAFWGAPLITRELETGTHRLVWNQSVTRTRWLTVKLVLVGGVSVLLTGALSLLLTWAAAPYDQVAASRFEPLTFAARDIAPFGYALLAFAIGLAVGVLARKTLLAMAVTIALFIAFQVLMATAVRPHFAEPVTETIAWSDANAVGTIDSFGIGPHGAGIQGYTITDAWVLSDYITVYKADGTEVDEDDIAACDQQTLHPDECMTSLGAVFDVTYQPADRYWPFQWAEFAAAAGLAALLIGLAFWRVPRGIN
ncbi:ABC-2 family transporter protein [Glycomyces sambucus]|uniref:ABC-2 family transporter protein n=1 Tax=Glycomyces sambucus TaxID=380244 RepID=A0A1G9F8Q1_9ACTN|nr:ABC transporter permease subunit [Glycomyces sambucus]SDK84764.1 ABC-2 family transporter protein [Glycomyces sambucus]